MKKEKLENKQDKTKVNNKGKYEVIQSFCGIEKGRIIPFTNKNDIKMLLSKKLIKKC